MYNNATDLVICEFKIFANRLDRISNIEYHCTVSYFNNNNVKLINEPDLKHFIYYFNFLGFFFFFFALAHTFLNFIFELNPVKHTPLIRLTLYIIHMYTYAWLESTQFFSSSLYLP